MANNTPYNQFKFENFGSGDSSACAWRIQSLDLFADNMMVDIPNFTYDASVTVYKDIEMSEVIPENADHDIFDFDSIKNEYLLEDIKKYGKQIY